MFKLSLFYHKAAVNVKYIRSRLLTSPSVIPLKKGIHPIGD